MQQLADHFEVSRRTVFRDLALLRESGVSAQFNPAQRAVTARPQRTTWTPALDTDKIMLLVLAARTSFLRSDPTFSVAIDTSIAALLSKMPAEMRAQAGRLLASSLSEQEGVRSTSTAEQVVQKLILAVSQDRPVRLRYRPADRQAAAIHTKVIECRFVIADCRRYLLGRSSLHRNWRRFELPRIEFVEVLDETLVASKLPARPWRTRLA